MILVSPELTSITVSSCHTGIIRWHDLHRRLRYWDQFRSYRYRTLPRRTSVTVLLRSTQVIQVSYAGTTYIVDCVIGVRPGHTVVIRWRDVYIVDCVIGIWSGHTNMIRWHDVYICDCVICVSSDPTGMIPWHDVCIVDCYWGQLRSYRYRTLPRRIHRWLCYLRQLRSYKYHMLARRTSLTVLFGSAQVIQVLCGGTTYTSLTVLLGSARVIQVSYAGTTYIVDCVIGVSSCHTGIIRWHDLHRRLRYWDQLRSYRYHLSWLQ